MKREETILIFDFGGGTLDISVVRVGDPKTRQILANGGIPIAGDIFDQRLVRHKLPPHFGEGSTYSVNGNDYPVPSYFYEAFNHWQDLLMLQLPDQLETLRQIERTARRPSQLRALINLITSSYGLKLFDLAEQTKRQLSEQARVSMRLEGTGFSVFEMVSRTEFERMIRAEAQAIEARLDEVIAASGVRLSDIDAVIRTGGSSQIPLFIGMLEQRFGRDKVRDLDLFGSITAGLGVTGYRLEAGELSLTCHTPEMHAAGAYLNQTKQGVVAVVDLTLVKQMIQLRETTEAVSSDLGVILMRDGVTKRLRISAPLRAWGQRLEELGLGDIEPNGIAALMGMNERVLLMTTDYRLMVKSVAQLLETRAIGLALEDLEGFRRDAFGSEMVSAMVGMSGLSDATYWLFVTTLGYGRLMKSEALMDKLGESIVYQMPKSRGYPAALIGMNAGDEVVMMSQGGRVVRYGMGDLPRVEGRLLQVALKGGGIASVISVGVGDEMLLCEANGRLRRMSVGDVARAIELNTNGERLAGMGKVMQILRVMDGMNERLWGVTTERVLRLSESERVKLGTDERFIRFGLLN